MGGSSSSSMRGFLMFDSGLVRGVTLFLLSKVPGPLFTSYGKEVHVLERVEGVANKNQAGSGLKSHLWSVSVGVHCLHI